MEGCMRYFSKNRKLIYIFLLCTFPCYSYEQEIPYELVDNLFLFKEGVLRKDYTKMLSSISDNGLAVYSSPAYKSCYDNYCAIKYYLHDTGHIKLNTIENINNWYSNVFTEDFIHKLVKVNSDNLSYNSSWWADYWMVNGNKYEIVFDNEYKVIMIHNPKAIIPSYECAKTKHIVEKAICSDLLLSIKDRKLSSSYSYANSVLTGTELKNLKHQQLNFIKKRNTCNRLKDKPFIDCIIDEIDTRDEALSELIHKESNKPITKITDLKYNNKIQGEFRTINQHTANNITSGSASLIDDKIIASPLVIEIEGDLLKLKSKYKEKIKNNLKSEDYYFSPLTDDSYDTICKITEGYSFPIKQWLDINANNVHRFGSAGGSIFKFGMHQHITMYLLDNDCGIGDAIIHTKKLDDEKIYLANLSDPLDISDIEKKMYLEKISRIPEFVYEVTKVYL